jgi:hypothetical protein
MVDLRRLSWFNSQEDQRKAMDEILHTPDFDWSRLILPGQEKYWWANCALVLSRLPDETLAGLLDPLMVWFQDITWPGATIILKRLGQMPRSLVFPAYRKALREAKSRHDGEWEEFLTEYLGYLEVLQKQ